MKKNILLLVLFCLVSIHLINPQIIVKSIEGFAQYKKTSTSEWIPLKVEDKLENGYIIYTGFKSNVTIQTPTSIIEVKPLTQMTVESIISTNEKISTDLYLKYGKIKAVVNPNKQTQTLFKVRSANSTASVRGTSFVFGENQLFVEDGTVLFLTDSNFSLLVQKDEASFIDNFGNIVTPFQNKIYSSTVSTMALGTTSEEENIYDSQSKNETKTGNIIVNIKVKGGQR